MSVWILAELKRFLPSAASLTFYYLYYILIKNMVKLFGNLRIHHKKLISLQNKAVKSIAGGKCLIK